MAQTTGFVVLLDRMAFQKHKLDDAGNPTIEADGPEEIVTKGHFVPDYVSDWQIQAFVQSGMISPVAVAPQAAPAPAVGPEPPAEVNAAPDETATRTEWNAYAEKVGFSAEEAASYPNKGALIDAVKARTQQ